MRNFTFISRKAIKCLLSFIMLFSWGVAWGQTTYQYTFTSKVWSANGDATLSDVVWTLYNDGGYYAKDNTKGQQIGSGNYPATYVNISTEGIPGTITSIKVNTSGANSINATLSVKVGGEAFGETITLTNTATEYTFIGTGAGKVELVWANSSSKAIYIKSIEITYKEGASGAVSSPKFTPTTGTKFVDSQTITASCATDGATIHYTTNGDTPTDASPVFPAGGLTITETTIINAIAVADGLESSSVVTATYTKLPVYTIGEVKALASGTADIAVQLTDAVVTGVSSKDIFVQDATGGIELYQSGQSYAVGDVLNGYVIGTFTVYNNMPEVTSGDYTNVTAVSGSGATPTVISIADLLANPETYYCSLIKVEDVTYADGTLSQSGNSLTLYNKLGFDHTSYNWPALADVTGVFAPYGETMQLYIRSEEDIVNTSVLEVPEVSWSADTYTIDLDATEFAYPIFTTNSDGEITYSSSNEGVATIASGGTITLLADGNTVITATVAASASYSAASASYTLTVTNLASMGTPTVFVAEYKGAYYAMGTAASTVQSNSIEAVAVDVVNGKVVNAEDKTSLTWYVDDAKGYIRTSEGEYLTSASDKTNLTLGTTTCAWTWSDENNAWVLGSRSFIFASNLIFKNYTYSQLGISGYSSDFTQAMTFADGYVRSTTVDKFGTICLPYAVAADDIAGATFYSVAGKLTDGGVLKAIVLTEETALEAGVPYIFCATSDKLVVAYNGGAAAATSANGLIGSLSGQDVAEGKYLLTGNTVKLCGTGCSIGANRAYFDVDAMSEFGGALGVNQRMITFDGTMTGINQIGTTAQSLVDVYTISGVKVRSQVQAVQATEALPQGIYVVNGKKVVVR